MKIETAKLEGAALDWAVAKCEGRPWPDNATKFLGVQYFSPSTNWAQGGPIIEREKLEVSPHYWNAEGWHWVAYVLGPNNLEDNHEQRGPTPLIAAVRCYVASKLGAEIEVPEALLK